MTVNTPIAHSTDVRIENDVFYINSRFGAVMIPQSQAIFFPHGLLGLQPQLHFGITDMPSKNMGQFKLLQCLNDATLSFVVLPLDINNHLIEYADVMETCELLNIKQENLLLMLIISVQRTPEGNKVTANVRAPVVVDIADRAALQYVFPHAKYAITHPLGR